jgi:hypothetical protein
VMLRACAWGSLHGGLHSCTCINTVCMMHPSMHVPFMNLIKRCLLLWMLSRQAQYFSTAQHTCMSHKGFILCCVLFYCRERVPALLSKLRLQHGPVEVHGTPRRLAVLVHDLAPAQTPQESKVCL